MYFFQTIINPNLIELEKPIVGGSGLISEMNSSSIFFNIILNL